MEARLQRALTQRMFLLSAKEETADKWTFSVQGTTGKAYKVTFTPEKCSCNCPDRTKFCKHIHFMRYRVVTAALEDAETWNETCYRSVKSAWRARFKSMLAALTPAAPSAAPAAGPLYPLTCCICFEDVASAEEGTSCPQGCKRSEFHAACIDMWTEREPSCPLCRQPWTRKRGRGAEAEDPPMAVECSHVSHIELLPDPEAPAAPAAPVAAAPTEGGAPAAAPAPAAGSSAATASTDDGGESAVDVVISFDATGSMYPCLAEVKRRAAQVVQSMLKEVPTMRIAIIAHTDFENRDNDDAIAKRVVSCDFTDNVDTLVDFIQNHRLEGNGGDYAECYEYVLRQVHSKLSWKPSRPKYVKALIMLGDAIPHDMNDGNNKFKIDWRLEAEKLKNRDISVFSVQCLYQGNREAYQFWNDLASITDGYHMFLDQFANITTMLRAICFRQHDQSAERLAMLEADCTKGGITDQMRLMFDTLTGRKTREEVNAEMHPDNFRRRFATGFGGGFGGGVAIARPSGGGAARFGGTTAVGAVDEAAAAAKMLPCPPSKFQIFTVDEDCSIKEFCNKMGIQFKTGRGFYEFTKVENISEKKEVVAMEKRSGNLFEGDGARDLIHLPTGTAGRLKPATLDQFSVFIQSTSYNRKLIGGSKFLYDTTGMEEGR